MGSKQLIEYTCDRCSDTQTVTPPSYGSPLPFGWIRLTEDVDPYRPFTPAYVFCSNCVRDFTDFVREEEEESGNPWHEGPAVCLCSPRCQTRVCKETPQHTVTYRGVPLPTKEEMEAEAKQEKEGFAKLVAERIGESATIEGDFPRRNLLEGYVEQEQDPEDTEDFEALQRYAFAMQEEEEIANSTNIADFEAYSDEELHDHPDLFQRYYHGEISRVQLNGMLALRRAQKG